MRRNLAIASSVVGGAAAGAIAYLGPNNPISYTLTGVFGFYTVAKIVQARRLNGKAKNAAKIANRYDKELVHVHEQMQKLEQIEVPLRL